MPISCPSLTFAPAEHAGLYRLGDRQLVFSPSQQKLIEVNATAVLLLEAVGEAASLPDIAEVLEAGGASAEAALAMAEGWLADACEGGILEASIPAEAAFPHERAPSLGGHDIRLGFGDAALSDICAPAYALLPDADGAELRIAVLRFGSRIAVLGDGVPAQFFPPERLATRLRHAIVTAVLNRAQHVALHAACLVGPEGAILLCGSPGAGKSTLTHALLRRGWGFGGDDIAFSDHAGHVRGLPLPLTVKQGSWPIIGQWEEIDSLPEFHRDDGAVLKYRPAEPVAPEWRPVRAVIRLERGETDAARAGEWDRMAALQHLFGEAYANSGRSSAGTVNGLVELVSGAECMALSYSEAEDAADLLTGRYGVAT